MKKLDAILAAATLIGLALVAVYVPLIRQPALISLGLGTLALAVMALPEVLNQRFQRELERKRAHYRALGQL